MKTVFTTQEGVKMNSELDFGSTKEIHEQFQYLMDTLETMFDEEFNYYYRVTDDNFIQLAYSYGKSELQIMAQYRMRFKNLKENITFIVKNSIEASAPFSGYPKFENSSVFTEQEFDGIVQSIKDEKDAISKKSLENITPLITYLKENNLNPVPSGYSPTNWNAQCPSGRGHSIMVSTKSDEWGCGYCRRKGGIAELESWLHEK
ncbi:hypothetical protein [uncultured Gelidibacter sp.]|uniref:hypothetical protein n=1 Tax=uncultured Gelidibacter sp. TaxID=259318 RepID=UPI002621642D|nr:hypothetical protein [uncultured Gelidibacter sp.]